MMMWPFPAPFGVRAARWSAFSDETIARPRVRAAPRLAGNIV